MNSYAAGCIKFYALWLHDIIIFIFYLTSGAGSSLANRFSDTTRFNSAMIIGSCKSTVNDMCFCNQHVKY